MNPGYVIISLDSLIKPEDVSLCLPASPRTRTERGGRRLAQSAHKYLFGDGKAFVHKACLTEVGHIPPGSEWHRRWHLRGAQGVGRKAARGQNRVCRRAGVYEGLPSRLERVGEHAERLVSMPLEVRAGANRPKEGRRGGHSSVPGGGALVGAPGQVDKDEIQFALSLKQSWRLSSPTLLWHPHS